MEPILKRALNATEMGLDLRAMKWHITKWEFHSSGEPWNAPEREMCLEKVNLVMVVKMAGASERG